MERSEPSFVPEWLKNSGSGSGGGGSSLQFASSQSDGPLLALPRRNKSSKNTSSDAQHSPFLDRSSSSNSRRSSSSNGTSKHDKHYPRSYSSFTRNHRDRDRDRDKLNIDDHWDADYSDPLRSIMTGRIEKDTLRRSESMASRKQGEVLQRRVHSDLRNIVHNNQDVGNGLVSVGSRPVTGMEKVAFERDFPSLGSEERPVTPDISRVPSPGLSRAVQSLSIGSSALIGEGWTSALAEVPIGVGGSTAASTPSTVSSSSASLSSTTGLNMAETLVQAPSRSSSAQQPSVANQKREELAVLQSMRLIPMTSSTPKTVALNPSDKLKPKAAARSGEPVVASKNGQQLPSPQHASQSSRGVNVKPEGAKTTHTGKLLVLKPGRENGASIASKDVSSPTSSSASKVANGHGTAVSTGASAVSKNASILKVITSTKVQSPGSVADKKPSSAQAQSRSDFFNLMRMKSLNNSPVHAEPNQVISSVGLDKSDEHKELSSDPNSPMLNDHNTVKCNGDTCTVSQRLDETLENDINDDAAIYPDEEEAAFLRSLGWEENAGDDDGLTEEEINAFFERIKLRPASKLCRDLQMKLLGQTEPQAACFGGASSKFVTPDS